MYYFCVKYKFSHVIEPEILNSVVIGSECWWWWCYMQCRSPNEDRKPVDSWILSLVKDCDATIKMKEWAVVHHMVHRLEFVTVTKRWCGVPHLCRLLRHGPTSARNWFRRFHWLRGRSIPRSWVVGSTTRKLCRTSVWPHHRVRQRSSAVTVLSGTLDQIGCLDLEINVTKALSHWASDRAPTLPTQKIGKSAVKSWHNRGERGGVLLETYIVVAWTWRTGWSGAS